MNFYNKTRNILSIEISPLEKEHIQVLGLVEVLIISNQ